MKIMKFRGPIFLSLVVIALLIGAYSPTAYVDNSEKEAVLMQTILTGLNQWHYNPQRVNNEFSEKVYTLYLDRIDSGHRWLTQKDVAQLEAFQQSLDDEAMAGTYEFLDLAIQLKQAGLEKTQAYYQEILEKPFDFTKKEEVELDGEKKAFAKNDKELKEYWRKSLKHETLTRLNEKLEEQKKALEEETTEESKEDMIVEKETADDDEKKIEDKTMAELEAEARKAVRKLYDRWYKRMAKLDRMDHLSEYLNAVTNVYDPHSGYFKPIDKENFDISFSGRLEGIGARLTETEDGVFTKVSEIVVGGPAWKGKELEENDVITKVAQKGKEPVDINGMDINDVVQMVRGEKGSVVILTVKKVDGTVKDVSIKRDVVILEERFAKSLLLEGVKAEEKIGYIYLPGFYADFNDRNGHFSAKDVAAEIEKLKADEVNGIILDLRGNPGGSLNEVVKMSGLFIEDGPIVQVNSRGMKPEVLEDKDPDVLYDGPLVVMVNSFSASASEILAAALQDYERAVIVGTTTFGKGTVQRFLDLDRTLRDYSEIKPLGEIKLTIQKYYRIDGGSVQLRGVTPDIVLPDVYHYLEMGERDYDHALEWTEIKPAEYSASTSGLSDLTELEAASKIRVNEDPVFQEILDRAKTFKKQRERSMYPLQLDTYQQMMKEREAEAEAFKKLMDKDRLPGKVENLTADLPTLETADESKIARNDDFIKRVKRDVQLKEVLHIMHDMMSSPSKYSNVDEQN